MTQFKWQGSEPLLTRDTIDYVSSSHFSATLSPRTLCLLLRNVSNIICLPLPFRCVKESFSLNAF